MSQFNQSPSVPKNNTVKIVVVGCLSCLVVGLLGAGIMGYLAYRALRTTGTEFARAAATSAIQRSQLPAEEKQQITTRIDQLALDFKEGRITLEQMGRVMEQLVQSPLIYAGMTHYFQTTHVAPSGLSEDEKNQASLTLERYAHGLADQSIGQQSMHEATRTISTTDAQGNSTIKSKLTDDEIRSFLDLIRAQADEAEVPAEVTPIDISDELDKVIDKALAAPAPATPVGEHAAD